MNPFSCEVDRLREMIEQGLAESTDFSAECPSRLRDAVRYSLLAGGKRLRPLLTLLSCRACGGAPRAALPAALAIEMIHTYSLIHDDLPAMDNDDLRRGRPTNHRQFGEATAILAGDGLLTHAFEVLATRIEDPAQAVHCCRELAAAAGVVGMVGGQQADIEAESREHTPEAAVSVDKIISSPGEELAALQAIHRRKTGKIITCAVRMGAILAAATAEQLDALTRYGDAVGLAFQVMDDILDCTATEEQMGKGVGKDANRDKLTYPAVLGLVESRRVAESLVRDALHSLDPFGEEAADLRVLARYIIERAC
ncbi:MAG: polyprenyl synthetase family protein [Planctomycetaceae bacterium]|nr:polyprenyl synthetase family protein [Planctomycetaceae bacterium]